MGSCRFAHAVHECLSDMLSRGGPAARPSGRGPERYPDAVLEARP